MKVLIANNELPPHGGLGTWTQTMADQFERRGWDVHIWTASISGFSRRLGRQTTQEELVTRGSGYYDLALVQHSNVCKWIVDHRTAKHTCLTIHGKDYAYDCPSVGANSYVTISNELAEHNTGFGIFKVINPPVDMERYKPLRPISDRLMVVGLFTNYGRAEPVVREACNIYGCEFRLIGGHKNTYNTVPAINGCDLIVSVGRGAIEAMACARAVVIYDDRGYYPAYSDGYFLPEIGPEVSAFNYTGRCFQTQINSTELAEMFKHYICHDGQTNREYCMINHGVIGIVDEYLELAGLRSR